MLPPADAPRDPRPDPVAEPMRSRWSPSVFDAREAGEVDDDQLSSLLRAAAWAPSSGNSQPWSFVVVRRGTEAHDGLMGTLRPGNRAWVPRAPVVVVTAHRSARAPGEEKDPPPHAAYDLGQAVAHLTLQATALGLATHQFAGFDRERFAQLAGVPAWYRVMTGVAIGRHGDPAAADPEVARRETRERRRRDLAQLVHVGAWGRPWPAGDEAP